MVYSLSFATLDEYNPFPQLTRPLFARENEQLRISLDQLRYRTIATRAALRDQSSSAIGYELPRTLDDALRPSSRAVVITERNMPFNVVNVNKAWEELCGYTFTECHGRSLGSLIKGPKTDPVVVTALINQLLKGEVAAAVITNYKKNGQPFRNRLRVGPLYSNNDRNKEEVSHFVGILEEIAA
jgi:PAS domain S-box-containing protein